MSISILRNTAPWIHLDPLYTSEPERYHLLTACLFVKRSYIKNSYGILRDETQIKQQMYIRGFKRHIQLYNEGFWNHQTMRLRIYFDVTMEQNPEWSRILKRYRDHPFLQWVRYEIPGYKDPQQPEAHLGFIGTLVRFHPFFVTNPRITCVSVIDMDSEYTPAWKQELHKFLHANEYDFHCFSSIFACPFYGTIMPGIDDTTEPRGYWAAACFFSSKVRFPIRLWNHLLDLFEKPAIRSRLRFLDSFKIALFDNRRETFMEDFEYGLDEILLNDLIETYVTHPRYHYRMLVTPSTMGSASSNLDFLRHRFLAYLKWNDQKTSRMRTLYSLLQVNDYAELESQLQSIHDITEFVEVFQHRDVLRILMELQFDRRLIYTVQQYRPDIYTIVKASSLYMKSTRGKGV